MEEKASHNHSNDITGDDIELGVNLNLIANTNEAISPIPTTDISFSPDAVENK